MPTVTERAFRKGLILVCAHSGTGAMGLLINRRAGRKTLPDLLAESGSDAGQVVATPPIHSGGPADIDRPLVLHGPDYHGPGHTLAVTDTLCLTSDIAALRDLRDHRGPSRALIAQG
ncbi:MAG: YqgE/AlgH family protein, partial [Jannaschia sp.]